MEEPFKSDLDYLFVDKCPPKSSCAFYMTNQNPDFVESLAGLGRCGSDKICRI